MRLLELYIHIPFCKKKCKYCDFLSGPSTADERESYVKSLCQDIRSYAHLAKACRVISIFVGGGTPSTLTAFQMQQKQRRIKRRKQRIHRKMQIRQQMHQRMQMLKQKQQKQ